jgi:DNA repair exonuclease SbcCD nuclease subunit
MSSHPLTLVTADWHLTHNAWKWRPNLYGDAIAALEQVTQIANEYNYPVIAAGDMFDVKRPPLEILLRTRGALCTVSGYFIQGNHDKITAETGSWMSLITSLGLWRNLDWRNTWGSGGVAITKKSSNHVISDKWLLESPPIAEEYTIWVMDGVDYVSTREELQERLDAIPAPKSIAGVKYLLVLHQGCAPIFAAGDPELDHGMIPDRYDFVICGHYHKAMITKIQTKSGKEIPCLSPGGLHLLSVVEDPVKKLYLFCDDGSVYSKRLITRRVIKQDMQDATESQIRESLAELVKKLKKKTIERPKDIETPIVSVIYNSNTIESLRSLFEITLKEEGLDVHLFFKDVSDKDAYEIELARGVETEMTLETGFQHVKDLFRQSEQDPHLRQIVENMLDAEPSQENYDRIKNNFLTFVT